MSTLPAPRFVLAGTSHAGSVREANQDSFFIDLTPNGALALVADGMGGHVSGELASQKARDVLSQALRSGHKYPPLAVAEAVQQANLEIFDHAETHPADRGMGTTLTLVFIDDHLALVGHVGDSRAYLVRDGTIRQLTQDHSWVADRVRQGLLNDDEAKRHGWRNIITNSLGTQNSVRLELTALTLRAGDRLLLCSDGLTHLLSDEVLLEVVSQNPPEEAVQDLVRRANERGSPDNVTALVIAVRDAEVRSKLYALPDDLPVSVELGEDDKGLLAVEEAFPYRGRSQRLRRHPLWPYRYWVIGYALLIALFILFGLR